MCGSVDTISPDQQPAHPQEIPDDLDSGITALDQVSSRQALLRILPPARRS
jgi:hypothetical protein